MRPPTPAVHSTGCRPAPLVEEAPQARKGHDVKAVLPVLVLVLSTGLVRPATAQVLAPPPPNPFLGGVPSGSATSTPLALSIGDAIERALAHNLGVLTAEDSAEHARGERRRTLSELLPDVNGHVSETRQKVNLAAFGFPLPAGIPSVVGPFDVFDARIGVSQSVFDLGAINDARAQTHDVLAARYTVKSARDLVVLVAANLYLRTLAESSRADSADAQLKTAQALFAQAGDLKQSGLVAGIDVLRAQVQLSTEQQRATAAHNEFEKSKLQLARVIGLPLGQAFTLSDQLPYAPVPEMTIEEALDRAYKARPDYLAALERLKAAEASRQAIVGSALPSVHLNADYGALGLTVGSSVGTYAITGAVNVPIFQGGKTQGRLIQADADVRTRRAEADDLKAGIYYDVRTAFLDLQANGEQLQVATRAKDLAASQLAQARDRFAAGVADNIEVVQAQEAVALASEQYIAGLYSYNVSKAALARALGVAEESARRYLGGSR